MTKRTRNGEPMAFYLAHVDDETNDCVLWPYGLTAQGYGQTYDDGVSAHVHVLACAHAHGPKPDGQEVCHSCRNRHCFNPRHVRWGTRKENVADMRRDGTISRGERNGHAVLTESQVLEIRRRYAAGGITQQALADEYGMARSSISGYTNGHRWGWL